MKNRINVLKNRKVLTYIAIVILTPLLTTDLVEYTALQNALEIVTLAVAIIGIIDDPTTNHVLKK